MVSDGVGTVKGSIDMSLSHSNGSQESKFKFLSLDLVFEAILSGSDYSLVQSKTRFSRSTAILARIINEKV
eukprot:140965-Amphidinium_carterae.1